MHVIIVTLQLALLEGIQNVISTLKAFSHNP